MGEKPIQCIYCREFKSRGAFNKEHVIPQSFGTFGPKNFVLHNTVCKVCNSDYFSKHLEDPLGRDSFEGMERFQLGVRKVKKKRVFGRRVRIQVRIRGMGAQCDGAIVEGVFTDGATSPTLDLPSQFAIGHSDEGPFKWYRVEDLPRKSRLSSEGFTKQDRYHIRYWGSELEKAKLVLLNGGYEKELSFKPMEPPLKGDEKNVHVHIEGAIDRTIQRAIAKIAFNYFIYQYPSIARTDRFEDVRRFIRYGDLPIESPVKISSEPFPLNIPKDTQLVLHTVAVTWQPISDTIVGQVSLFSTVHYKVLLGTGFSSDFEYVGRGHIFDPSNRTISELTRLSQPTIALLDKHRIE